MQRLTVRIYEGLPKHVSEIPLSQIARDGWTWEEFVEVQRLSGRACVVVVEGEKHGSLIERENG